MMKQMRNIAAALTIAFMTMSLSTATAQSKVCHIASQELIEAMPEYKAAMSQLEKLQKTYDSEIRGMVTELQNTVKKYQEEAEAQTETENERRMTEVASTEEKIGEYRQNALKDLQEKELDLLKPIYEKARTAVLKTARAKGYDYVLDSTTGTGVIMADGYDLMPDVKRELGI